MGYKILCVAEKNSIAKAVASHLAGGRFTTTSTGNKFIKNYSFTFDFGGPWGICNTVMTSVSGHLTEAKFPDDYKSWEYPPPESLFEAPVRVVIDASKKSIATNITQNSRGAKALFIWTDCDREGEHIGGEVRAEALKGNPNLLIWRARFSNIERAHVIQAAKNPTQLDDRQVNAVAARIEIDLRIGLAFTRYLTLTLRPLGDALSKNPDGKTRVISYGSCQFPTLGFVVDRYLKVKNFTPENFWSIKVTHHRNNTNVVFSWKRIRLFDRMAVVIFFERCLTAKFAKVIKVQEKPTSKNDDKAHPPIHPVTWVSSSNLNQQEARVYEFVTRRFLACCSDDAKGQATDIDIAYGDEEFGAHGVVILARNYLDIYPYENWSSSAILPKFTLEERFVPTEAMLTDGKTTAPGYLTEPDLISLMDANGIGTDATMAEHIAKIKERNYVFTRPKGAGGFGGLSIDSESENALGNRRERRGGRGGRRGRGGAASNSTRHSGLEEFIPSTLGVALVDGYDKMGFETSLTKPFLRKEMELRMKDICEGRISRDAVLQDNIRQYKRVFEQSRERVDILKASCRRYVLGEQS
ncbi:DNA topoisomerase 3 [Golovinomyces cichoracearum]|uniref:DNA topoisomerase n=1 Tax=Golovinomyces cichoracearum TaxID=62708 RepID=A0A420HM31_9PEZI|nr:DNA topoisomerase 3 [Golovinomyces cichoracearum]